MNQAWYQVLSMIYGYLAAAVIALVLLLTLRKIVSDAALLRRVRKNTPQAGAVGAFRVLSAGTRRLSAGAEIRIPYEGTLGAAHSCDVCIPYRRVHMRSAFFWMERDGLHMVALHKDGFFVDDVAVEPGDEAILEDGAVLRVRELKLVLRLYSSALSRMDTEDVAPYVTSERRNRAQQGRGEGIGAPGKGEIRREKKLRKKMDAEKEKKPSGRAKRAAGTQDGQKKSRKPSSAATTDAGEKNVYRRKRETPSRTAKEKR
ncbi:MAG: hypothetical protein IKU34_06010 [Clostridia bacterium]|nr:hypothetical protein [Clostridia bacterium]